MKHKNNAKKSIHRLLQSMLMPAILMAMSALGIQACDVGHDDEPDQSAHCIPNSTRICNCSLSDIGVQVCQPNGTFEPCVCSASTSSSSSSSSASSSSSSSSSSSGGNCHELAGGGPNCGDGIVQVDEECDDGDCNPHNACNDNCRLPFCGDGIVQVGEFCDGEPNCSGGCSYFAWYVCSDGVFAGQAPLPPHNGLIQYVGIDGIDAANAACKAVGAFQMCAYEQLKAIEEKPQYHPHDITNLLTLVPVGTCTTLWFNRTYDLLNCPSGPGARCNNWTYAGDESSDGEFVTLCNNNGSLSFSYELDCDPVYDPQIPSMHNAPGMECSAIRIIPCCSQSCSW